MQNFSEIPGAKGKYLVNDQGDVYSNIRKKLLKQSVNNSGYFGVSIYIDARLYRMAVHRLVAETFLPNPQNKRCVNHLDGNKQNNCLENLEWATSSENSIHANRAGLAPNPPTWAGKFGADHNRSKVVYVYHISGAFIGKFGSGQEAARRTDAKIANVSKAVLAGTFSRHKRLLYSHNELGKEQVFALAEKATRPKKGRT